MPFDLISGKFVPEKSNMWRDCCDGYYDWVKEHIMEGAPLNEADHSGGGHLSCIKLLLEEGADIEQRNVMKETALIRASHNGFLHTVKYLLDQNADVNAIDLGDNTALHWAAMRGHVEIVAYLLKSGADTNFSNKQGRLPVDLCQPQWSFSWRYCRELLA
eukprot:gene3886-13951_t